jgi:hypothetical protein
MLSGLLLILSAYCAVMAAPLVVVGSFVGPTILIAAIVHIGLASSFFLARRWLLAGRRRAILILVVLSVFGLAALPIALLQNSYSGERRGELMVFPLVISVLAAVILLLVAGIKFQPKSGFTSGSDPDAGLDHMTR